MSQDIDEYIELLHQQRDELLKTMDGLPDEALDWKPLPSDTSSFNMLVRHAAGHLRRMGMENLTGTAIEYDRAAAFAAKGTTTKELADLVRAAYDEADATLQSTDPVVLHRPKLVEVQHPLTKGRTLTPRFMIVYAVGHIWNHVGHLQLTRQLWEAQR